jgi:transposase, IS5 family
VDEGRLRAGLAGGFQQVEGADGVGVEVVEGNGRGAVVRGLGGGVDDGVGFEVGRSVRARPGGRGCRVRGGESGAELGGEALLVPAGVALRSEKDRALVVVDAVDLPAEPAKWTQTSEPMRPEEPVTRRIRKAKLEHPLFEAFKGQLMKEGMIARRGRIIDATFVDVPRQRNKREENEQIKNGNVPDTWKEKSPAERRQKDLDARWTKKNNEVHYGYKNHVQVDRESKLVVDFVVTDASVHDSQALEQLVKPGDPETWVDSGYAGVPCEEIFKACEVKGHIIDRAYRNKPLTEAQKRKNRKKSQVRVRVEHVFGTMCMTMCAGWNRCIGMARNYLAISMTNLIYNLVRFEQIKRLNLKKWRTC